MASLVGLVLERRRLEPEPRSLRYPGQEDERSGEHEQAEDQYGGRQATQPERQAPRRELRPDRGGRRVEDRRHGEGDAPPPALGQASTQRKAEHTHGAAGNDCARDPQRRHLQLPHRVVDEPGLGRHDREGEEQRRGEDPAGAPAVVRTQIGHTRASGMHPDGARRSRVPASRNRSFQRILGSRAGGLSRA